MSEATPHAELLATPLDTVLVGSRVLTFREVDSTNDHALRLGGDGIVIVADSQRAGRGRHGRRWHSAAGLGLWFSVAFEGPPLEGLACAAALAVRAALRPYCRAAIKWPNDLHVCGRKLCGILVEHRDRRSALGIGINVHHRREDFPEAFRGTATSVDLEAGPGICRRGVLLRDVLTELDERVRRLRAGSYETLRQEWADACGVRGRRVRYGETEGIVADIDGDGALIIDTAEGLRRMVAGDIRILNEV